MPIVGLQSMFAALAMTLAGVRGEASSDGRFALASTAVFAVAPGGFEAMEFSSVDLDLPDYSAVRAASGTVPAEPVVPAPQSTVHRIPPVPSSAAMFLSAVLSVGAWHAVRSARHLHVAPVPEWYHTGGPIQIGHAVPYDFQTEWTCHAWDQPELDPAPNGVARRNQDEARPSEQGSSPLITPRGPPTDAQATRTLA